MAFTLPENYGYVLLVAVSSGFLTAAHTLRTASLRKAARVPYPNALATANEIASSPEKFRFNCASRAETQFHEHHTTFVTSLVVAGLRYPEIAAGLGASWLVARIAYLVGYTRKSNNERGQGRLVGGWYAVPEVALLGMAVWTGVSMVWK